MHDFIDFILENIGILAGVALVLFNMFVYLARRYRRNREQEQYGHSPPAVRSGRLSYEEYKKRGGVSDDKAEWRIEL